MNEKFTNELGYAERSSHQENKVGSGLAGGFNLMDIHTGEEFDCSMGSFSHAERRWIWENRDSMPGKIVVYRSFSYGVKEKPRFPRAKGFRDPIDMS